MIHRFNFHSLPRGSSSRGFRCGGVTTLSFPGNTSRYSLVNILEYGVLRYNTYIIYII